MKLKTLTLLLAGSLITAFFSCSGDSETHELKPAKGYSILFADQTVDSVLFYTFDSWSVTSQTDWITTVGNSHADIVYDNQTYYQCRVDVSLQPNTTGKTREGLVLVKSYDYAYNVPFYQLGILEVTHPLPKAESYYGGSSSLPDVATFTLTDSAHWEADSICFRVRNSWGLRFADGTAPDWIAFDGATTGQAGTRKVRLTLTPNTDTENAREAVLELVSGEVKNQITVRQLAAKKE